MGGGHKKNCGQQVDTKDQRQNILETAWEGLRPALDERGPRKKKKRT